MAFLAATAHEPSGMESAQEPEMELMTRLRRMGKEAVEHQVNADWRRDATMAYQFEAGDQWTKKELEKLEDRRQPPTVENRIRKQRKTFMGLYHKFRLKAAFLGRNLTMDQDVAQAFNDLNLYWFQRNDYQADEARAVRDHWIGGVGWIEAGVREGAEWPAEIYSEWEDPFCLWRDPHGTRRDMRDWRYLLRAKWIDLDVATALYPDKKEALRLSVGHDALDGTGLGSLTEPDWKWANEWTWYDAARDRVRVVEAWYRRKAMRPVALTPQGQKVTLDFGPETEMKRLAKRSGFPAKMLPVDEMWVGIFCGDTVLHHDRSPYHHGQFPFVPFIYDMLPNGQFVGWVSKDIQSLQVAHNKRHSKALHLLTTNRAIYTESAVKDDAELARQMADPEGHIKLETSKDVREVFNIVSNTELGQGQLALYQHVREAFNDAGGVSQVQQGMAPGEVRSDRGLQRLQGNAEGQEAEIFEQIKASRRRCLLVQTSNIQQFMSGDQILQVTEDEGVVRTIQLSAQQLSLLKTFHADLTLTEEFYYENANQQAVEQLMQILPQVLQFGVQWAMVLVELSQIKAKKKIMEILTNMAQQPPTIDPKVNLSLKWDEMSAFEKATFAAKMGMMELAQMMMEGNMLTTTEKKLLGEQMTQASKERMEQKRLDLKAVELDMKLDEGGANRRLSAMQTAAQEETKRMVATQAAAQKKETA